MEPKTMQPDVINDKRDAAEMPGTRLFAASRPVPGALPGGISLAVPESPVPDWPGRNRTPDPLRPERAKAGQNAATAAETA